jgi:hypothetical protein
MTGVPLVHPIRRLVGAARTNERDRLLVRGANHQARQQCRRAMDLPHERCALSRAGLPFARKACGCGRARAEVLALAVSDTGLASPGTAVFSTQGVAAVASHGDAAGCHGHCNSFGNFCTGNEMRDEIGRGFFHGRRGHECDVRHTACHRHMQNGTQKRLHLWAG